ncbi:hypothetical protein J6590_067139 [Homalodisca vitripennis]|nr:hypothetical protein J6590_067139 [Homalodisca vitripennis]
MARLWIGVAPPTPSDLSVVHILSMLQNRGVRPFTQLILPSELPPVVGQAYGIGRIAERSPIQEAATFDFA